MVLLLLINAPYITLYSASILLILQLHSLSLQATGMKIAGSLESPCTAVHKTCAKWEATRKKTVNRAGNAEPINRVQHFYNEEAGWGHITIST